MPETPPAEGGRALLLAMRCMKRAQVAAYDGCSISGVMRRKVKLRIMGSSAKGRSRRFAGGACRPLLHAQDRTGSSVLGHSMHRYLSCHIERQMRWRLPPVLHAQTTRSLHCDNVLHAYASIAPCTVTHFLQALFLAYASQAVVL